MPSRLTRHTRTLALCAVLSVLPRPTWAQSSDLERYVLFATSELRSRGLDVSRGDVGVNDGPLFVRMGVLLNAPGSEISSDRASVPSEAVCKRLIARSPGAAAPNCPASLNFVRPFVDERAVGAACGYPEPFPACGTSPDQNVEVQPGEARVLTPGTYGQVVVRSSGSARGVLTLRPGTYRFCGLRTSRGAEVVFEGPTTLFVAGIVRIGSQSVVNPTAVDSHLINVFASGSIARLARDARATLRVCAPFSTLRMGRGVQAAGRFVARSIVAAGLMATLPTTTTTSTSSSTTTSTSTSSTTTTSTSTTSTTTSSSSSTTTTSTSTTSTTSLPPRCGDGMVNQPTEECDDGNASDGDCCSNDCLSAPDDIPCGTGDVCSGDATCQTGVCTPTSPAQVLACLAPLTSAVITNFDDGTAATLDLGSGALGDPVPVGRGAWGVAIHPAGHEIWVTAREDDLITILDASTHVVRETLTAGSLPLGILFGPGGTRAYVASFGTDRVLVIDVASRTVTATIPVGDGPSGLALDPTGGRLYVSNFGGNSVSVIDLQLERVVRTIKTKKRPLELALDATRGRLYVTMFAANRMAIVGTVSDSILATVRVGKRPFGVAVDPVQNRIYVTNAIDDTVSLIDGVTCAETSVVDVGDGPLGIGLDLPGTRAIIANSNDASISILDTGTGTVASTLPVGATPVAFGGFVGPRANTCPRSPLTCNDANPMTLDSCSADTGCRFEAYPPEEAADVGLSELDTVVREAGVELLGGTKRAVLLSRLALDAHTALVEGAGTPSQRIKRADRSVRRFTKVVQKGIRRRKMSCDVAQGILDLSRGVRVQLKLARS